MPLKCRGSRAVLPNKEDIATVPLKYTGKGRRKSREARREP